MSDYLSKSEARRWIVYATRFDEFEIALTELTDSQIVMIGTALSMNPLLNPPRKRPLKHQRATCKRCGRVFIDQYRTRRFELCPDCRR